MITNRVDVEYDRKGKVKSDTKILVLTTVRVGLPFTERSRIWRNRLGGCISHLASKENLNTKTVTQKISRTTI